MVSVIGFRPLGRSRPIAQGSHQSAQRIIGLAHQIAVFGDTLIVEDIIANLFDHSFELLGQKTMFKSDQKSS